jgi:outer membrane protein OmpA-like peptidoglycan-associated protein
LVGSSEKGPEDGLAMASSIKKYLVEVWSITQDRIAVEGNYKPEIPSEQEGGTLELELLRQGDRRVSIESTSPALLMEFQTGRKGSLKPVEINTVQTAPIDSYVSFNAMKGTELYYSWSLEIKDKDGIVQNFGPYTQNKVSIPGKSILGTKSEGDYKVTMVGKTKTNTVVRKDTTVHLVLWKPAVDEEGMRYSILYEFNESTSIQMYEKYLTDIVAPKIPSNATVIIHGHSDIIGDEANNERLSTSRANNVHGILKSALDNLGRKNIIYEVDGLGENETLAPFENNFPEERFYNRTVIIDVIPKK